MSFQILEALLVYVVLVGGVFLTAVFLQNIYDRISRYQLIKPGLRKFGRRTLANEKFQLFLFACMIVVSIRANSISPLLSSLLVFCSVILMYLIVTKSRRRIARAKFRATNEWAAIDVQSASKGKAALIQQQLEVTKIEQIARQLRDQRPSTAVPREISAIEQGLVQVLDSVAVDESVSLEITCTLSKGSIQQPTITDVHDSGIENVVKIN